MPYATSEYGRQHKHMPKLKASLLVRIVLILQIALSGLKILTIAIRAFERFSPNTVSRSELPSMPDGDILVRL